MIISNINIISIDKRLNSPLINSKNKYQNLKGYYVFCVSEKFTGKGEVSVLRGFSKESLQEISWIFESFKLGFPINDNLGIKEFIEYIGIHTQEAPALRFALETAIYDIYCQRKGISLAAFFRKNHSNYINLSTIFTKGYDRTAYFDTVKLKIGANSLSDDLIIMNKINKINKMKFRLDANQSLSLKDLLFIEKNLSGIDAQYIEEPFKNLNETKLLKLQTETSFAIAVDESIYNSDTYKDWIKTGLINYIVIKPSIFGGYSDFFNLTEYAEKYNVEIIVSSALETHVGHMAAVHLAACINNSESHGLDYYAFYKNYSKHIYSENESRVYLDNIKGLGVGL